MGKDICMVGMVPLMGVLAFGTIAGMMALYKVLWDVVIVLREIRDVLKPPTS